MSEKYNKLSDSIKKTSSNKFLNKTKYPEENNEVLSQQELINYIKLFHGRLSKENYGYYARLNNMGVAKAAFDQEMALASIGLGNSQMWRPGKDKVYFTDDKDMVNEYCREMLGGSLEDEYGGCTAWSKSDKDHPKKLGPSATLLYDYVNNKNTFKHEGNHHLLEYANRIFKSIDLDCSKKIRDIDSTMDNEDFGLSTLEDAEPYNIFDAIFNIKENQCKNHPRK